MLSEVKMRSRASSGMFCRAVSRMAATVSDMRGAFRGSWSSTLAFSLLLLLLAALVAALFRGLLVVSAFFFALAARPRLRVVAALALVLAAADVFFSAAAAAAAVAADVRSSDAGAPWEAPASTQTEAVAVGAEGFRRLRGFLGDAALVLALPALLAFRLVRVLVGVVLGVGVVVAVVATSCWGASLGAGPSKSTTKSSMPLFFEKKMGAFFSKKISVERGISGDVFLFFFARARGGEG